MVSVKVGIASLFTFGSQSQFSQRSYSFSIFLHGCTENGASLKRSWFLQLVGQNNTILHSQYMTKIQVGHSDKSWSNLGRLTFDQDFMSWLSFDQHFTIGDLDLDQDLANALVKTSPQSTPSNLGHTDHPLTKIRLRILGLGYECMSVGETQCLQLITHQKASM